MIPSARKAIKFGDTKITFWIIFFSKYHRNMILVSKYIFLRWTDTMGIFPKFYLWQPSWNPRWPPQNLCFYTYFIWIPSESCCCALGYDSNIQKLLENDEQSFLLMKNNIWCRAVTCMVKYGVIKCKGGDFRFGQIKSFISCFGLQMSQNNDFGV